MKRFNCVLNTVGDGYWSGTQKSVTVTRLGLPYVNEECDFGELRVYFDRRTWNTDIHGLIYTDSQFIKELRSILDANGMQGKDVDYSEQGMQGNDYVSCDVGKEFIQSWLDAA